MGMADRLRYRRQDGQVFLFAFDLLELDGRDMRREPLEMRKRTLAAILVGLAPADGDQQSLRGLLEILDVERDELGPTERPGESEQKHSAIAQCPKRAVAAGNHAEHKIGGRRLFAHRSGADRAPDAGQNGLHAFFRGRARLVGGAMEIPDRGETSAKCGGALAVGGFIGKKCADHFGGRWNGGQPTAAAPLRKDSSHRAR